MEKTNCITFKDISTFKRRFRASNPTSTIPETIPTDNETSHNAMNMPIRKAEARLPMYWCPTSEPNVLGLKMTFSIGFTSQTLCNAYKAQRDQRMDVDSDCCLFCPSKIDSAMLTDPAYYGPGGLPKELQMCKSCFTATCCARDTLVPYVACCNCGGLKDVFYDGRDGNRLQLHSCSFKTPAVRGSDEVFTMPTTEEVIESTLLSKSGMLISFTHALQSSSFTYTFVGLQANFVSSIRRNENTRSKCLRTNLL